MPLTLGDLLDQPEFGLELRAGGERARAAAVEGAHSIDLRDPVRWLQEHWVMLTTGLQLRGSASAQRRLVAQLADGGLTALGFGVGIAMQRVPGALLHEAERREFAVFTVPYETPFREIVSFVNRSALSADLYVLRRLTSMQRYLLDAMHQPAPAQALVERLGSLLGGADVAYLDAARTLVAATAPQPDWIPAGLRATPPSLREFERNGRWGVVAPVVVGDAPSGWLAALLPSTMFSRQVARPVVRAAADLLALVSATQVAGARGRRSQRARLGARLERLAAGEREDGLAAALAAEGIDFTTTCRVTALTGADGERLEPDVRDAVIAAVEGAGAEPVIPADAGVTLLLVQHELADLVDWLRGDARLSGLRAGVSEPLLRLDDARTAIEQARLALTVAQAAPVGPTVQRYEALEPSVALLGPGPRPRLRERLTGALAPLDDEPRLRAAVVAYLEAGLDVGRAARALRLHRNSLRYRLDRAEQLLGRSLRSPAALATIHLALVAERLGTEGDRR